MSPGHLQGPRRVPRQVSSVVTECWTADCTPFSYRCVETQRDRRVTVLRPFTVGRPLEG